MRYRGTRVDEIVAAGSGRVHIRDGASLDARITTLPAPLHEVRLRSAAYLNVAPEEPVVMAELLQHYHRVSRHHVVPRNVLRPPGLAVYTARYHPRRLRYDADACTRVVAHLIERPRAVAAQFSAAALLGITDFADSADTALLGPFNRRITDDVTVPSVRREAADLPTWTLRLGERTLRTTPPMLTLAHCLRAVLDSEHAWSTPAGLPPHPATIRGVQLIDRFRREFGLTADHIAEALHGLIAQRTLTRLLALSDAGADSPPETVMRLVAREAAPHLEWCPQVPVYTDGSVGAPGTRDPGRTLLTVLDLAATACRRFLYYDGDHHLDRSQRDRDSAILAQLTVWNWTGLRVTAGMLADVRHLNALIRALAYPRVLSA